MIKLKYIFQGYKNYILDKFNILNSEQKILYNKRKEICNKCKYKINFTNQCGICGCFINQKTKANYELDSKGLSINGCPCSPKRW